MFSRSKYSYISKLFCRTVDSHQLIFILDVDCINSISMCDKYLTRVTRRVPLLEKDLLILPVQMCSSPILSCVRTTESLVCMQCYNVRRPIFVFFSFFLWSFYCLSFCVLQLLATPFGISQTGLSHKNIRRT